VQFRTTGRDDNSAYTARTSWISSGSDFAFTGSRAHDAQSRKNHNRKNNLDSFSPPRLQARQAGEDPELFATWRHGATKEKQYRQSVEKGVDYLAWKKSLPGKKGK
jgi:hypothetical protein